MRRIELLTKLVGYLDNMLIVPLFLVVLFSVKSGGNIADSTYSDSSFLHTLSKDLSALRQGTDSLVFDSSTVIDLIKRVNHACQLTNHSALVTTNATFAEELSKLTGRLLLSYFIAGPSSLDACFGDVNAQKDFTGRLFFCLPGINCIRDDREAIEYWKSPRSELVHSFFQLSQVLPMGLMADKRVLDATRRLLRVGLNEGDLLSQHPTGWPSIKSDASSFIITPVIMWQFASSYFFAGSRIERRFKSEMHKRIDYIAPRVNIIASAAASDAQRDKLPSFVPSNDPALQGKHRLLVIAPHWSPGHSSFRITAPIINALARRSLSMNTSIAVSLLYATSQRDFTNETSLKKEGFIEAHSYSIADDDVVGAEALSMAIATARFDAIFFPSLAMSGADVVISSHRLAPLQIVSYGHSASSSSPNIDVFVAGFEAEVLGPVSSDIYEGSVDCSPVLEALVDLAKLDAELRILPSSISPLCETSLPPHLPFSASLRKSLLLARRRYSEALLLVPGLGISFTPTFPAIARSYRAPLPFPEINLVSLIFLAKDFQSLTSGKEGKRQLRDLIGAEQGLAESSKVVYRGTKCAPVRVALVYSLVKWNSPHLDRLFEIIYRAKRLYKEALTTCSEQQTTGVCAGFINAARECSSDAAFIDTRLYVSLTAFTAIDTDAGPLKLLAVNALLSRLVSERFSDGSVSFSLLHNASQPVTYLGALSKSDVAIDSSPFGACNAMQDFLSLAIPISGIGTVLDLDDNGSDDVNKSNNDLPDRHLRWRSTIGASMQTKLGLTGLVSLSEEAFYYKSSHLLFNPFLRLVWQRRMHANDDADPLVNGADEIGKEIETLISSFNRTK